MSDDFEGKLHDLDPNDSEKNDDSSEQSDEEEELEKQMGDLQGDNSEKLDEKVVVDFKQIVGNSILRLSRGE